MESVDRLREFVTSPNGNGLFGVIGEEILNITDDIEREHSRLTHEAVCKAHADGERSALKQVRSASEDYRKGYAAGMSKKARDLDAIMLPKDSDGEPLRPGDEVEVGCWPGVACVVRRISLLCDNKEPKWCLKIVQRDHEGEPGYGELYLPWPDAPDGVTVRHAKKSVEDILREMMSTVACSRREDGVCEFTLTDEQLSEYASKLQLKED